MFNHQRTQQNFLTFRKCSSFKISMNFRLIFPTLSLSQSSEKNVNSVGIFCLAEKKPKTKKKGIQNRRLPKVEECFFHFVVAKRSTLLTNMQKGKNWHSGRVNKS